MSVNRIKISKYFEKTKGFPKKKKTFISDSNLKIILLRFDLGSIGKKYFLESDKFMFKVYESQIIVYIVFSYEQVLKILIIKMAFVCVKFTKTNNLAHPVRKSS